MCWQPVAPPTDAIASQQADLRPALEEAAALWHAAQMSPADGSFKQQPSELRTPSATGTMPATSMKQQWAELQPPHEEFRAAKVAGLRPVGHPDIVWRGRRLALWLSRSGAPQRAQRVGNPDQKSCLLSVT